MTVFFKTGKLQNDSYEITGKSPCLQCKSEGSHRLQLWPQLSNIFRAESHSLTLFSVEVKHNGKSNEVFQISLISELTIHTLLRRGFRIPSATSDQQLGFISVIFIIVGTQEFFFQSMITFQEFVIIQKKKATSSVSTFDNFIQKKNQCAALSFTGRSSSRRVSSASE